MSAPQARLGQAAHAWVPGGHVPPRRPSPLACGSLPLAAVGQRSAAGHQRIGVACVQLQGLVVARQRAAKVASLGQRHAAPAGRARRRRWEQGPAVA